MIDVATWLLIALMILYAIVWVLGVFYNMGITAVRWDFTVSSVKFRLYATHPPTLNRILRHCPDSIPFVQLQAILAEVIPPDDEAWNDVYALMHRELEEDPSIIFLVRAVRTTDGLALPVLPRKAVPS